MTLQQLSSVLIEGEFMSWLDGPFLDENHPNIAWRDPKINPWSWGFGRTDMQFSVLESWRVENHKLYLTHISGGLVLVGHKRVFADWVSGTFVAAKCRMPWDDPDCLFARFSNRIQLTIRGGSVTEVMHIGPHSDPAANLKW